MLNKILDNFKDRENSNLSDQRNLWKSNKLQNYTTRRLSNYQRQTTSSTKKIRNKKPLFRNKNRPSTASTNVRQLVNRKSYLGIKLVSWNTFSETEVDAEEIPEKIAPTPYIMSNQDKRLSVERKNKRSHLGFIKSRVYNKTKPYQDQTSPTKEFLKKISYGTPSKISEKSEEASTIHQTEL